MPERQHFNGLGFALHAIVEVIPNSAQKDATCVRESYVCSHRSDVRLSGDELECLLEGFTEGLRGSRPIQIPPFRDLSDLPESSAGEPQRERRAQSLRSSRQSSSSERSSPRSASSMAAKRAASASGPSVKVPRSSGARIVTTRPSAKSSPGTSILPLTTLPVVTRMG